MSRLDVGGQHCLLLAGLLVVAYTVWTSMRPLLMWKLRKVPGSRGWPIIGHLPQVITHDLTRYADILYHHYHGRNMFQVWLATVHNVVIRDVHLARKLLQGCTHRQDVSQFVMRCGEDKKIWDASVFFSRGKLWRTTRKVFEAALINPHILAAQLPFIDQVVSRANENLTLSASSGQPVDILAAMHSCSMDAIGWATFGIDLQATARQPGTPPVPYVDNWWHKYTVGSQEFANLMLQSAVGVVRAQDLSESSAYVSLLLFFPGLSFLWRAMARWLPDATLKRENNEFRGLRESIKVLVATWRSQQQQQQQQDGKKPADEVTLTHTLISDEGFLARLLSGCDLLADEKLQDYEIVGQAIPMVLAGYETTGTAMAVSLWCLSHHSQAMAKAHQEVDTVLHNKVPCMEDFEQMPYISAVMTEAMRLYPPVGTTGREVGQEGMDLGNGQLLPAHATVYVPIYSFHRDPSIWPRASEYLPERHIQPGNEHLAPTNPHAYMPFGYGSRMCPGYKYAQMEARIALARLLQRFSFEPVPGVPEPVWRTSMAYAPSSILLSIRSRV